MNHFPGPIADRDHQVLLDAGGSLVSRGPKI